MGIRGVGITMFKWPKHLRKTLRTFFWDCERVSVNVKVKSEVRLPYGVVCCLCIDVKRLYSGAHATAPSFNPHVQANISFL